MIHHSDFVVKWALLGGKKEELQHAQIHIGCVEIIHVGREE